jgi:hypothetical protein
MRSHGIPNYPDPNSAGGIVIDNKNDSMDENSPQYISANSACQKLLPNGGHVSSQNQSQLLNNALRFTQCMRAHGIPRFPDPTADGNGGSFDLQGSGLNPDSPQVRSTWQLCARSTHFNF